MGFLLMAGFAGQLGNGHHTNQSFSENTMAVSKTL